MTIKRRRRLQYGESSAASDMAFLLIIYFMVIAGFYINQGFLINLPAKDSVRMILKDDLMRFDMDNDGIIFYEGTAMDRLAAERNIRTALVNHPDMAVVLTVASAAPWQQVVSFVELAEKLEVQSFSFKMKADS